MRYLLFPLALAFTLCQLPAQTQTKENMDNLAAGQKYMAANAKKDGVKSTKSGIQYEVIKSGTGATPKITSSVLCHYEGTLINGTVFDSSYKRGEPITFPLRGVIPGWTEILQLMKEGDKWKVTIPANLAYGEDGAPPVIPPNATLIFTIELIKVQ
jgi:FKBP-type peptidyl-prolyl cis-trans isomerase